MISMLDICRCFVGQNRKMYGWKCCVIEIYNEEAAQQLVEKILHQYIGVFVSLEQQIRARYEDEVLEQL